MAWHVNIYIYTGGRHVVALVAGTPQTYSPPPLIVLVSPSYLLSSSPRRSSLFVPGTSPYPSRPFSNPSRFIFPYLPAVQSTLQPISPQDFNMFARILLLLTLACLFMTASSTRVGFQPRSRSTSATIPGTKTSTSIPATTPILPVRTLNHVTRTKLVERKRNPKAKRATTSTTPFPASDCSGYTSTGTVPWAVYTNLDIDDPTSPNVGGITSREACRQRCQASSSEFLRRNWYEVLGLI
jgi:hypothetical protein